MCVFVCNKFKIILESIFFWILSYTWYFEVSLLLPRITRLFEKTFFKYNPIHLKFITFYFVWFDFIENIRTHIYYLVDKRHLSLYLYVSVIAKCRRRLWFQTLIGRFDVRVRSFLFFWKFNTVFYQSKEISFLLFVIFFPLIACFAFYF